MSKKNMKEGRKKEVLLFGTRKPSLFYTLKLENLDDFKNLKKILDKKEEFIFRGQSKFRWDLETSLEVRLQKMGVDIRDPESQYAKLGYEKCILTRSLQWLEKTYQNFSNLDLVLKEVFIQHHNGATRLLDFTSSIDIALYFSLYGKDCKENLAIWILNREQLQKTKFSATKAPGTIKYELSGTQNFGKDSNSWMEFKIIDDFEKLKEYTELEGEKMFSRVERQKGLFLSSNNFNTMFKEQLFGIERMSAHPEMLPTTNKIFEENFSYLDISVIKVEIEYNEDLERKYREYLNKKMITFDYLFPDYDEDSEREFKLEFDELLRESASGFHLI